MTECPDASLIPRRGSDLTPATLRLAHRALQDLAAPRLPAVVWTPSPDLTSLLQSSLERLGEQTLVARNPDEVLDAVRARRVGMAFVQPVSELAGLPNLGRWSVPVAAVTEPPVTNTKLRFGADAHVPLSLRVDDVRNALTVLRELCDFFRSDDGATFRSRVDRLSVLGIPGGRYLLVEDPQNVLNTNVPLMAHLDPTAHVDRAVDDDEALALIEGASRDYDILLAGDRAPGTTGQALLRELHDRGIGERTAFVVEDCHALARYSDDLPPSVCTLISLPWMAVVLAQGLNHALAHRCARRHAETRSP